MSEDYGLTEGRRARTGAPGIMALLAANVAIYLFQFFVLPRFASIFTQLSFANNYALSLDGLRAGHYWQLLTFQFLHGSLLHIFVNSWAIFVFGRAVEETLGTWRMLGIYFLSGVAGGLVQMLGSWTLPGLFGDDSVIGASAGAYGLVAAFVAMFPSQRLLMLLFFFIPMAMRARTLLRMTVVFSLIGIVYPLLAPFVHRHLPLAGAIDSMFLGIGHAAHLGGMATGFALALCLGRGRGQRLIRFDPKRSLKISPAQD